jgi:AcrR family transcriptional regulator
VLKMLLKQAQDEKGRTRKEDPRVTRTRQLLLEAFMELMNEKSFQSITVQDITDRATVNRVTFYAHFQDKYSLLEYTIREMIRQRLRSQLPEGSSYSPENLARLILTVCEFLDEMGRHCPPPYGQLEPLMEKQIKVEVYERLRGWLAEQTPVGSRGSSIPERAAMVASWAIYGAAVQWIQQEPREPAGEYVQQVLPMILGGFQLTSDPTTRLTDHTSGHS